MPKIQSVPENILKQELENIGLNIETFDLIINISPTSNIVAGSPIPTQILINENY